MTIDELDFTQVEDRLIRLTADGVPHKPEELLACLEAGADKNNLKQVLFRLRAKLEAFDQDIIAQSFGTRVAYIRVRKLRAVGT